MIIKFGLIAEGKTDLYVIENILIGLFGDDNIRVNDLQPLRDETNEENFAGWQKVFEYCRNEVFKGVFQLNDFIVIQIDTDVSEDKGYDVFRYRGHTEKELNVEELIEKVKERIIQEIDSLFFESVKEKVIFAIAVDSIECWLLPLVYDAKKDKQKIDGCLKRVNFKLKPNEKLSNSKDEKNPENYEKLSLNFLKKKTSIKELYQENPSLKIFIEDLQWRNIDFPKADEDW